MNRFSFASLSNSSNYSPSISDLESPSLYQLAPVLVAMYKRKFEIVVTRALSLTSKWFYVRDKESTLKKVFVYLTSYASFFAHMRLFWTSQFSIIGILNMLFFASLSGFFYWKTVNSNNIIASKLYLKTYTFFFYLANIAQLLAIKN